MSISEEIKILLLKEKSTIKELAAEMTKKSNKTYTMQSLSKKLARETLRADEYKLITHILGYDIQLIKTRNAFEKL